MKLLKSYFKEKSRTKCNLLWIIPIAFLVLMLFNLFLGFSILKIANVIIPTLKYSVWDCIKVGIFANLTCGLIRLDI